MYVHPGLSDGPLLFRTYSFPPANPGEQRREPLHLARELSFLRDEGVLVLGSGDIVHNLRAVDFGREEGYDWAVRFDEEVRRRILSGDFEALVAYDRLPDASLAVPTPEHFLPLLYLLASKREGDAVSFFNAKTVLGSISMTSVEISAAA